MCVNKRDFTVIEKLNVNIILTTVSGNVHFLKGKDYVEQETIRCGIVWEGGTFSLKAKKI